MLKKVATKKVAIVTIGFFYTFTWIFAINALTGFGYHPARVSAAMDLSNYAVYFTGDPTTINDDYENSNNTADDYFKRPGLSQLSILTKDFLGLGSIPIPYSQEYSERFGLNKLSGVNDKLSEAGELFFVVKYYCSANDKKFQLEPFDNNVEQYEIDYAIGLFKDNDALSGETGYAAKDNFNSAGGAVRAWRVPATSSGQSKQQVFEISGDLNDDQVGSGRLDDAGRLRNLRENVPQGCVPDSIIGENGNITNHNNLSEEEQRPFATAAEAAANGDNQGEDGENKCEKTGPLSWIICPILNIGFRATDYIFSGLVRPLLEDIPVSTDPEDDSFKAWKAFRTLGNIVLVGALLAVVYAQTRSDK